MPWDKTDAGTLTFECDDCQKTEVFDAATDFCLCWKHVQSLGWRSFKRIGHPWTFHCVACGPAAEMAQREHKRQEVVRDRIKNKNSREQRAERPAPEAE